MSHAAPTTPARESGLTTPTAVGSGDLLGMAVNFSKTNNKTKIWN